MLPTFVEKGSDVFLNSLKRYTLSGVLVPSQANGIIKVPAATATNPGMSVPTPLEGPQDAHSELHSITGAQGLTNFGLGTISSAAAVVTGLGTKFLQQVAPGDTIIEPGGQSKTVLSVQSDTQFTTTVAFGPALSNVNYGITTPIVADVRDRMTCMIQDVSFQRTFMNFPVPVNHLFGDNQKPSMLCERLLLQKNHSLRFQLFNNSTVAAGSMGLSMEARKWQIEATERYNEVDQFIKKLIARGTIFSPYWLTLDQPNGVTPSQVKTTIPAGGSVKAQMTNTGSNWLFLFYAYGHAITTGVAGDTQEIFSFANNDGETRTPLVRQPSTLNTGLGTAQNPYRYATPLMVPPRNQVHWSFNNLITDQPTDVFVTLGGVAMLGDSTALTDPAILEEARRIYNATTPDLMQTERQTYEPGQ